MTLASAPTARDRLDATLANRVRVGAAAGSVVGPISLVFDWTSFRAEAEALTVTGCLLTLVSVLVYRQITRHPVSQRWCHAAVLAIFGIGQVQIAIAFGLDGDPTFTLLAMLLLATLGLLEVSRGWLAGGLVAALALWLPLGFAVRGTAFPIFAFLLIGTAVVTLVVHEIITSFLLDLEGMRLRDRARELELSKALDSARHELAEREHAEQANARLREQLLHAQKLEAVGTLAGGVAHDMNNMLAAIVGIAETLREDAEPATAAAMTEVLEAAHRGAALTRNLMGFSRRGSYRKSPVAVSAVIDGVVKLLRHQLAAQIEVVVVGASDARVDGDAAQLTQAVVNLCLNAADAMAGGGQLRLEVGVQDVASDEAQALAVAPGRYVTIRVIDNGGGMGADVLSRIFEPFFTTKPQGSGTGLGLAMVYGTMKTHDGAVTAASELGHGTTMTLLLPALATSPVATSPAPARLAGRAAGDGGVILVVDDEPAVRAGTTRYLERAGYQVVTAGNGREAVEVYERMPGKIAAVVLDMSMPVMGGAACFAELRRLDPDARVVVASGYAPEQEVQTCLEHGATAFLEKPFSRAQLLDALAPALQGARHSEAAAAPRCASA